MSKKNNDTVTVKFNMRASTLEAAKDIAKLNGISISEAINHAVEVEKFLQDERAKGNQILLEKKGEFHKIIWGLEKH